MATIEEQESRLRLQFFIHAAQAVTATFLIIFGLFIRDAWLLALILLGGMAAFLLLQRWALRPDQGQHLPLANHLFSAIVLVDVLLVALFTGQNDSVASWYLLMMPLIAGYLGGLGSTLAWAALALLALTGLWLSERLLPITPIYTFTPALAMLARAALLLLSVVWCAFMRQRYQQQIQQLSEARQAAEAASRLKSSFLANMSHEIRTPLNGIIGLNNLILEGPLDEDKRPFAELARQSGETLLHLINDFLDFSRLEADHLRLEELVFDPHRLVAELQGLTREACTRKGLRFVTRIEAPHAVCGDSFRLRQILLNLVNNAVKFTEHGEITLRCRVFGQPRQQTWLRFEVEDSGIGIDAETQARLFQPFMQADTSTTRRFGGTGLGLAICKKLTEMMGGRLGVTSVLGEGSRFWLELPFTTVAPEDWPAAEPECELSVMRRLPQGRVLLVEDNLINQRTAQAMLRHLGCHVDVVANGLEAVAAFGRGQYDIVFMDCDMPIMDGLEATQHIRTQEPPPQHVPIVAVTAAVLAGDREKCLAAGMDDYLPKPVRLNDLHAMLGRWVQHETAN